MKPLNEYNRGDFNKATQTALEKTHDTPLKCHRPLENHAWLGGIRL
jgi:hypothetical protein